MIRMMPKSLSRRAFGRKIHRNPAIKRTDAGISSSAPGWISSAASRMIPATRRMIPIVSSTTDAAPRHRTVGCP